MQKERIVLLNNKQQKLVGYLYKNTSKTIVIMCHGIEILDHVPRIDTVFQAYHATGASIFYFHFTGYGESAGKNELSIKQRVSDIGNIVEYFSFDYKEIILYGISFSGAVAAIAASKYKKITKLIVVNGFFTIAPHRLYVVQAVGLYLYLLRHPRMLKEYLFLKKNLAVKVITIPTLVVYGKKDRIIRYQQSKDFYKALQTKKDSIVVPNGDHALMRDEDWEITKAVPAWIKKQVV